MDWIAPTASFLEILLLLYVATIDIATRLIRNEICLALALLGIAGQLASPMQVAQSLIAATIQLLTVTALAGGVLALAHLMMRLLPSPRLAPAGSSFVRRVYAIERWRHLRHAPLPYGVAIACGGIWTIFSQGL